LTGASFSSISEVSISHFGNIEATRLKSTTSVSLQQHDRPTEIYTNLQTG